MDLDLEQDEDAGFEINQSYADSYNKWRQKEELQKLKDRYQTDDVKLLDQSSSESETEDEDAEEVTPHLEKDFLTTLGCLKKKDPKIYDKNVVFFAENEDDEVKKSKKKSSSKPKSLFLRDYERKIIVEKEGHLSDEDSENENMRPSSPSYAEQQKQLKNSFKSVMDDSEDDSADDALFKQKVKTKAQEAKEEKDYMKWLKGQSNLKETEINDEMKFLRNYWTDPKLDHNEKFLRDFIINKNYLDKDDDDDENDGANDPEVLSEDEKTMEEIEDFEHKYNFRFEEPDPEFIKRYPRTMTNTLRKKDNKRATKREEVRERKIQEKQKKKEDLKMLKIFKRNEIMEKLEKLKEITGNKDLGFKDSDLDGDFDPQSHDKKMQEMFDDGYYEEEETDQKPVFSDDDGEMLDIENWDDWNGQVEDIDPAAPDCQHPDFNMDADFDPMAQPSTSQENRSKKSRRKNSKFAKALSKVKPVFDPHSKSFEDYFDEYYKLDYEDIIDDMPVRFKYRKVPANDFGLSVDEVLVAKEKDLNRWCSVKKMCQYRTDEEEHYDIKAFEAKSQHLDRKRKLMPSLFEDPSEITTNGKNSNQIKPRGIDSEESTLKNEKDANDSKSDDILNENLGEIEKLASDDTEGAKNSKKKRRRKAKKQNESAKKETETLTSAPAASETKKQKKKRSEQNGKRKATEPKFDVSDSRLQAYGLNPKKFKNKLKYKNKLK